MIFTADSEAAWRRALKARALFARLAVESELCAFAVSSDAMFRSSIDKERAIEVTI